MTTLKTIAIFGLVTGTLVLSATAKVFWSWPAARGHALLETTHGWKTIYTSSVRINDGQGKLTVIGCNEPLTTVMTKLRQAYPGRETLATFRQNESMGWARISVDGAIVTWLALAPNTPEQTMLFELTQAPDDFDKSRLPPSAPRLQDPMPYPGSRVQTYLTSEESQIQLEIYAATTTPETVQQYYKTTLLGQAWTRLDPAGTSASLAIYQKGPALCAVMVLPADGSEIKITVLHKHLKME